MIAPLSAAYPSFYYNQCPIKLLVYKQRTYKNEKPDILYDYLSYPPLLQISVPLQNTEKPNYLLRLNKQ